ncbi:hypothetical protein CHL76_15925 [Marinococcus halophilus]|uniref:Apea-like HEPN domain-containing protein n=1 Tax=Marinococcus halophilus TaxID=1371 RepID=A0A510Y9Z2_MARHA|nr:hypothetical protein [Marinococcus halophilus]OZT78827.1 hypothetical protein CHL76_15925 [Marinococcus halophilus]GEK60195.1 hypothetical protein MHA01_31000 [Marinococcus halophilus]
MCKNSLKIYNEKLMYFVRTIENDSHVELQAEKLKVGEKERFKNEIMVEFGELTIKIEESIEKEIFFDDLENLEKLVNEVLGLVPGFFDNFILYKDIFFAIIYQLREKSELGIEAIDLKENFQLFSIDNFNQDFFVFDKDYIEKSFLIIRNKNKNEIEEFLENVNISLNFYLLDSLDFNREYNSDTFCLINNENKIIEDNNIKIEKLKTIVMLNKISNGEIIHTEDNYEKIPSVTSEIDWSMGEEYEQFKDAIYILSEYNMQTNVLDKYVKIYQVIENFMYKKSICELVNNTNPSLFSIRKFQNLFAAVNSNELVALQNFMKAVFEKNYKQQISFKSFILDYWETFLTNNDENQVSEALKVLGINHSQNDINGDNIKKFFTKIIYYLRNAIVHNKETEFHLFYGNLWEYAGLRAILKELLIPLLEEIVFYLLINKNDIIWYDKKQLLLYE